MKTTFVSLALLCLLISGKYAISQDTINIQLDSNVHISIQGHDFRNAEGCTHIDSLYRWLWTKIDNIENIDNQQNNNNGVLITVSNNFENGYVLKITKNQPSTVVYSIDKSGKETFKSQTIKLNIDLRKQQIDKALWLQICGPSLNEIKGANLNYLHLIIDAAIQNEKQNSPRQTKSRTTSYECKNNALDINSRKLFSSDGEFLILDIAPEIAFMKNQWSPAFKLGLGYSYKRKGIDLWRLQIAYTNYAFYNPEEKYLNNIYGFSDLILGFNVFGIKSTDFMSFGAGLLVNKKGDLFPNKTSRYFIKFSNKGWGISTGVIIEKSFKYRTPYFGLSYSF